jgi:hypothetical protein
MSLSQEPTTPSPASPVVPEQPVVQQPIAPVMPQQPVMEQPIAPVMPQQPVMQQPVAPVMPQQPVVQQPVAPVMPQQPVMQQPVAPVMPQQPVMQQPVAPVMPQQPVMQQPVAPVMPQQPVMQEQIIQSPSSGKKGKMIAAISLAMVLLLAGVFYVWADSANLFEEDEVDFEAELRFESSDHWGEITNDVGDGLVIVTNVAPPGASIEYSKIVVILEVDNGSEVQCDYPNSAFSTWCIYDHADEDSVWSFGEEILIYEGDENLCDGATNWSDERSLLYCDVKVSIYERSEDSENKLLYQASIEAV